MSPLPEDRLLLHDFVTHGSRAAFESILRRYSRLVYSSALRQTRDTHLADDITQQVFILLARKAYRIPRDVLLSAWLLATTRYCCANARRARRSRAHHERKAAMQSPTETSTADSSPDWDRLSPLLDAAIASLSRADQQAILLRFFENRPIPEIASIFNVSDDSARHRIFRAIGRLRTFLTRRNIDLSVASIDALLLTHATQSAPVHAAGALVSSALRARVTPTPLTRAIFWLIGAKSHLAATAAVVFLAIGAAALAITATRTSAPVSLADAPPTTSPAPAADTPIASILQGAQFCLDNDREKVRSLLHATTPAQTKVADAYTEYLLAEAELHRQCVARWPDKNPPTRFAEPSLQRVRNARVEIDGDRARVYVGKDPNPLPIVKVDGLWKLAMTPGFESRISLNRTLEQATPRFLYVAAISRQIAADVAAGDFATLEEAIAALQKRIDAPPPRRK
jgi:RNA polymerase sigma factor (sigma-70 family)